MVYAAWATVLAGLLFVRRSTVTFALATLFGGIILFVSGLNWMHSEINPLVPVLKSPWLMFHVAVIVCRLWLLRYQLPDRTDEPGDDEYRRKEKIRNY